MAIHSLYPSFIKLFYTSNTHTHKHIIPVSAVPSGSTYKLIAKVTPTNDYDPWTAGVTAIVNLLKTLIKTTDSYTYAELWTLSAFNADPIFREVFNVSVAGTNAGATVANSQAVMTLRTNLGGVARIFVMEGTSQVPLKLVAPFSAGAVKDLSDFLIGNTSPVIGRDGATLTAPVSFITKTNDVLRRKFHLNV